MLLLLPAHHAGPRPWLTPSVLSAAPVRHLRAGPPLTRTPPLAAPCLATAPAHPRVRRPNHGAPRLAPHLVASSLHQRCCNSGVVLALPRARRSPMRPLQPRPAGRPAPLAPCCRCLGRRRPGAPMATPEPAFGLAVPVAGASPCRSGRSPSRAPTPSARTRGNRTPVSPQGPMTKGARPQNVKKKYIKINKTIIKIKINLIN